MSKLKDKKIKKLRKKRIWPSIFGLLILLCIFSLIILISMASSCLDIVQRKLNEGSDQAVRIAELFEEYEKKYQKRNTPQDKFLYPNVDIYQLDQYPYYRW